jgi:uncharacterized protein YbjQ (UPF0145 family)
LTLPVPVVDAEPIGAPCSSGTPSKPTAGPDDVLLAAELVLDAAAVEEGAAADGDDDVDEPLLPQADMASDASAASVRARSRRERVAGEVDIERNRSLIAVKTALITSLAMAEESPPPIVSAGLPMTTAFELPGTRIRENLGVCYGLVVRSMGFAGGVTASLKGLRRGEIGQYTQLLEESRRHAIDRMVENARLLDADAVIAVRFDSSEIGQQFTEVVAYGTAVKVQPA